MKAPNFLLPLSGFSKYKYDPVTGTVWSFVRKEPRPLQWCMVDKYGTRKIVSPINDDGAKVPLAKSQIKMYVCMNTNAAGLKKGDRVLIDPKLSKLALELGVGSDDNHEHSDYDNCWTDEMHHFIGKEGTVIGVFDEDGVAVRTDDTQSYYWPADVLKKIEKTETPIDAGNLLTDFILMSKHTETGAFEHVAVISARNPEEAANAYLRSRKDVAEIVVVRPDASVTFKVNTSVALEKM